MAECETFWTYRDCIVETHSRPVETVLLKQLVRASAMRTSTSWSARATALRVAAHSGGHFRRDGYKRPRCHAEVRRWLNAVQAAR